MGRIWPGTVGLGTGQHGKKPSLDLRLTGNRAQPGEKNACPKVTRLAAKKKLAAGRVEGGTG